MREEGTSWSLVRPKIIVAPEAEKAPIRASADWRAFFVDICDNDDMGLAVQLLGGDLEWKLGWIKAEGTNWQRLVQVIAGAPRRREAPIRTARRGRPSSSRSATTRRWPRSWRAWAVTSSGGSAGCGAEDSNWSLVARELKLSPDGEKAVIRSSPDWMKWFVALQRPRDVRSRRPAQGHAAGEAHLDEGRGRELAERPREDRRDRRRGGEARRPPERRDEAVPRGDLQQRRDGRRRTLLGGDLEFSLPG